jgi:hypothetical protein
MAMPHHSSDDPRNSINYFVGGADVVRGQAQRVVRLMDDCIRYLREDDGHGLGDTPEHAVKALEHALKEARELVRDVKRRRDHFYRKSEKTNPQRRRPVGLLRCAGCRGRDAFIRIAGKDYCPVCAGKLRPKKRR